jgi:hypothetical protein
MACEDKLQRLRDRPELAGRNLDFLGPLGDMMEVKPGEELTPPEFFCGKARAFLTEFIALARAGEFHIG